MKAHWNKMKKAEEGNDMIVDCNPEFGCELALALPYAYWLHERGQLEKVVTTKGMKPFYYFCKNVEERYEQRSLDNFTNNGIDLNGLLVTGGIFPDFENNLQMFLYLQNIRGNMRDDPDKSKKNNKLGQ